MKVTEETTLIADAITTMNKCIEANKSKAPYKQLLAASEKLADGVTVGVAVYKDDPATPHDFYTLRFEDGQVELAGHGKDDHALGWKVSTAYLEKLAEHPEDYIEHPVRMDWDWLTDRLKIQR